MEEPLQFRTASGEVISLSEGDQGTTAEELPSARLRSLSYANLNPTDFEEFVYDLMGELGFVNVDWRKGTPKKASPSDRGRDIVAQLLVEDVDGHKRFETWFVDAKHYEKGVPPDALQGLMTWAESERPDVALVVASGFLSNAAKDWIESYRKNRSPSFRIRHWEGPNLAKLLDKHRELIERHNIIEDESVRMTAELIKTETEFYNKLWYHRSTLRDHYVELGNVEPLEPEVMEQVKRARQQIFDEFGADELAPYDDWTLGYISGKLATLRWVLGDDWDNLDT